MARRSSMWPHGFFHLRPLARPSRLARAHRRPPIVSRTVPASLPFRAYELYLGTAPARASWDLIATLYAVRPEARFWRLRDDGYNHIFPNGTNEWRDQPDSPTHRLLLLADGAEEQLKTALEELMIQPPRRR